MSSDLINDPNIASFRRKIDEENYSKDDLLKIEVKLTKIQKKHQGILADDKKAGVVDSDHINNQSLIQDKLKKVQTKLDEPDQAEAQGQSQGDDETQAQGQSQDQAQAQADDEVINGLIESFPDDLVKKGKNYTERQGTFDLLRSGKGGYNFSLIAEKYQPFEDMRADKAKFDDLIGKLILKYNSTKIGFGPGTVRTRLTGGRKTKKSSKKNRKTRKHRRNKTRGFTLF
jgi:hypothetical protein